MYITVNLIINYVIQLYSHVRTFLPNDKRLVELPLWNNR